MTADLDTGARRRCGDCTACCTVMGVKDHPDGAKAPGIKCKDACSRGCRIYAARPPTCRDFACVWLQGAVPRVMRPDKIGVVFTTMNDGKELAGHTPLNKPEDWLPEPAVVRWLEKCGRAGAVVSLGRTGSGKVSYRFGPEGMVKRPSDPPVSECELSIEEDKMGTYQVVATHATGRATFSKGVFPTREAAEAYVGALQAGG